MACRFGFIVAILAVFVGAPPAKAQSGGDVGGIWLTQAGDAKVRVSKCGGGLCGVIVWLKDPINPATVPTIQQRNRDGGHGANAPLPTLRKTSIRVASSP